MPVHHSSSLRGFVKGIVGFDAVRKHCIWRVIISTRSVLSNKLEFEKSQMIAVLAVVFGSVFAAMMWPPEYHPRECKVTYWMNI